MILKQIQCMIQLLIIPFSGTTFFKVGVCRPGSSFPLLCALHNHIALKLGKCQQNFS